MYLSTYVLRFQRPSKEKTEVQETYKPITPLYHDDFDTPSTISFSGEEKG